MAGISQRLFAGGVAGRKAALLALTLVGWTVFLLRGLPYWGRMEAAEGQTEIQTRFHGAAELAEALSRLDQAARTDAWAFYALDLANALIFGLALAGLIRFGLGLWRRDSAPWTGLMLLPLACALTDLAENVTLAAGLALTPDVPGWLLALSSGLTALKLATGLAAIVVMLALVLTGLARQASRRRDSGQAD